VFCCKRALIIPKVDLMVGFTKANYSFRKEAIDALSALGSVGLASLPIHGALLNKELNNAPPYSLWEKMIKGLQPNGSAMAGATLAMLISGEFNPGERIEISKHRVSPDEIVEWVLARDEVRNLKNFSQIQRAINQPKLLD
jgi:hypothetical protein